jgi:diacylglycerol kinase (ATP)
MANQNNRFNIRTRLISFRYAFKGIWHVIKQEHNAWIQLIAAIIAIVLGFVFHINKTEWIAVIFCIGFVISAEITNTSIEKFTDRASPQESIKAGMIKDIAAGAVLVAALTALVVGLLVFLPYLIR